MLYNLTKTFLQDNEKITIREVIAQEFEKYAKSIREMKWITWKQWQKDRNNAICPNCGKRNFDID